MTSPLGHDQIRGLLAAQAYRSGTVRLVDPDLSGCDHLVATRRGLFAVNQAKARLVAYGFFYGLTIRDDHIYAFEACDRPRHPTRRGRIVRFRRAGDRIVAADVLATGLDNGCHQIDMVDDRLCVLDTYGQQILRYPLSGGEPDILRPIAGAGASDWANGYAHVNSLLAHGDTIVLMLHNGADKTGRPSEVATLDRDWRLLDRTPIDGRGCHSFAVLEDGAILTCGSFAGELLSSDGLKLRVTDMLTRGLSVNAHNVVVGGTAFADRDRRDDEQGAIYFLDRDYRRHATVAVPGAPMEIRRIDGQDRSLSSYLASAAPGVTLRPFLANTNVSQVSSDSSRSSGP